MVDEAFSAADGVITQARGRSDGVTFAIEVGAERIWSEHVEPGSPWREFEVDLSRWKGLPLDLALVSDPGPDGKQAFDYALWSGLRVRGASERRDPRPHVVLVDIDTLRADRLGCYGADRNTSPRLDAWAAEHATLFTDATATASWTLPSTASMLTGLAVHQHRVDRASRILTAKTPPLALLLAAAGYETLGLADGGYVRSSFGFDLGFDVYASSSDEEADWDRALDWIGSRSERPMFLFLQTYMVHAPYAHDERFENRDAPYDGWLAGKEVSYDEVIEPFREGELELGAADRDYIRRMYDALVARMDERLGPFLDTLDERLAGEPYLLVITSDHGEAFFEHGLVVHGQGLYRELLQVPMIVRFPEGRTGRDDEPVSILDIVPTVLDYAGLPVPDFMPGRSLRDLAPTSVPRVSQHSPDAHAVHFGDFKLITGVTHRDQAEDETVLLFHRDGDPDEGENLADAEPDTVARMTGMRDEFVRTYLPVEGGGEGGEGLDAATMAELEALGYLTGDGDG